MSQATAVIVAAGSGQRLGAGVPKAFVEMAGAPMLVHAVTPFLQAETIAAVVVVAPRQLVARTQALLERAGVAATVCEGGETRQQSVSAGLDGCPQGVALVAVHDAARPLVSARLIDRTVAALADPWDAVAPGLAVTDTLKLVEHPRQAVLRTVDRQGLWAVQTPQVFRRSTLERVHARVASAADAATDDLALVERAGGRVRLIEGERRNFKITYPEDLALAESLLKGCCS